MVRGGDEVRDADGRRIKARGDQPGVMRDVGHQQRAALVGDGAKALPVDGERIRRRAGDDELRLLRHRDLLGLIVVDLFFLIELIRQNPVQLAGQIHWRAMREVAAVRQRHAEDGVARLERRGVHRLVRLRARMRLYIRPRCAEQLFRALDGDGLGDVHVLAAAVITLARIALGVLVGELAALCDEQRAADVILRCDQLDVVFLALVFLADGGPNFGIGLGEKVGGEHFWACGKGARFYQRQPGSPARDAAAVQGCIHLRDAPSISRMSRTKSPSRMIDQRIKELGDWRGKLLSRIRGLIKQADPEVVEEWKWRGVPVWSHDGLICTGETYRNVVKMTFAKGAALEDPSRLFNASLEGNTRRAIDFREGEKIDEEALKALVRAAVTLNKSKARS